jgi:hypothetical protein
MALESASAWPAMSYSIHHWPGLAQSETRIGALSHLNPAPGDQLQNQDDEGNNEQNVNQTARDVKTQAKRPKNKKNYQDVPKHKIEVLLSVGLRLMNRRRPVPRMPPSPHPHLSESQMGASSSPILERRPSTHLTRSRSVCRIKDPARGADDRLADPQDRPVSRVSAAERRAWMKMAFYSQLVALGLQFSFIQYDLIVLPKK